MACPVILSPRAIRDLEETVRYISHDNPAAALKLGHALIARARSVGAFPEIGRVVPEIGDPEIREVIFRSYRIVYRFKKGGQFVEVARFWHGAQGTPRI